MMKSLTFALAGAAAAIAVPAAAQETTADRPFSGVYVGAAGGYDVQENDSGSRLQFDRNLDGNFSENVTSITGANAFSPGFCAGRARGASPSGTTGAIGCKNDKDGWAYYGRVGADAQRGHIVVGAVGEFGKSEINDSVSGFSTTPASYTFYRELEWEASIRGRAGFAMDRTLFYGTFGPGYARVDRAFFTTNTANAFAERGKRNNFGITGGGGLEQKITNHVSFGLEYMFHQYRDDDYRVRVTAGTALAGSGVALANNPFLVAPNTTATDIKRRDELFRWHSIRGTLAFRF